MSSADFGQSLLTEQRNGAKWVEKSKIPPQRLSVVQRRDIPKTEQATVATKRTIDC